MNLLETYIGFSIKYNILVGKNLNNDLKIYIWNIYKKLYAYQILENFLKNKIRKCRDCNFARWNFLTGYRQKFYYVSACNTPEFYFTDVPCCMKYICLDKCRFNLNCSICNKINKYSFKNRNPDTGWNDIESEKSFDWKCRFCSNINRHNLVWNHNCKDQFADYRVIGKLF